MVVTVEAAVDTVAEAVEVAVEAVAVTTVIVVLAAETAAVDTTGINPTTLQTFKSNESWTFFMPLPWASLPQILFPFLIHLLHEYYLHVVQQFAYKWINLHHN